MKINDIFSHLELMKKFDLKMTEEDRVKVEAVGDIWQILL